MKLGIDIGGTTINIGIVDGGKLKSKYTIPSFKKEMNLDETMEYLCSSIESYVTSDIESIGIGVPSVVDIEKGIVYDTANIPSWKEVHLKEYLEKRFGIPVSINNDANCYTIGAAAITETSKDEIFVGVTLGTGVGIGVYCDGHILSGANTGLGELTWIPYNGKPIEYWCGKQFFCDKGKSPAEFYKLAKDGNKDALELFDEYGKHMAALLAIVVSAYDPHKIVFGGGLSNSADLFEPAMLARMKEIFPFPESIKKLNISYLPQSDAAIFGAALL